jgi:hypothetical protein
LEEHRQPNWTWDQGSPKAAGAPGGHVWWFPRLRQEAQQQGRMKDAMHPTVAMPKLLIVDEIGYPPFGREQANLFFQPWRGWYDKGSMILTSYWRSAVERGSGYAIIPLALNGADLPELWSNRLAAAVGKVCQNEENLRRCKRAMAFKAKAIQWPLVPSNLRRLKRYIENWPSQKEKSLSCGQRTPAASVPRQLLDHYGKRYLPKPRDTDGRWPARSRRPGQRPIEIVSNSNLS